MGAVPVARRDVSHARPAQGGATYDDPPMSDLGPAVNAVVRRCLAVAPGEEVLVVVDDATEAIGEALRAGAAAAEADAMLIVMGERANDGTEPPRAVAEALRRCDVFIAPTPRS